MSNTTPPGQDSEYLGHDSACNPRKYKPEGDTQNTLAAQCNNYVILSSSFI